MSTHDKSEMKQRAPTNKTRLPSATHLDKKSVIHKMFHIDQTDEPSSATQQSKSYRHTNMNTWMATHHEITWRSPKRNPNNVRINAARQPSSANQILRHLPVPFTSNVQTYESVRRNSPDLYDLDIQQQRNASQILTIQIKWLAPPHHLKEG